MEFSIYINLLMVKLQAIFLGAFLFASSKAARILTATSTTSCNSGSCVTANLAIVDPLLWTTMSSMVTTMLSEVISTA